MLSGTRRTILEIDALLSKSALGYIVIQNDQAFLYTENGKILLHDDHRIKVVNDREYVDVPFKNIFNLCDSDMYLYAGRDALVSQR